MEKKPIAGNPLLLPTWVWPLSALSLVALASLLTWALYPLQNSERVLLEALHELRGPIIDRSMLAATTLGDIKWVGVASLFAGWALWRKHRNLWVLAWFLATPLVCTALTASIKRMVARPRPDPALYLSQYAGWFEHPTSFSFPSGHSSMAFALSFAFLFAWRFGHTLMPEAGLRSQGASPTSPRLKRPARLWLSTGACIALLYASITGFSRVYLGVHYPSDVLGGWCIGFLSIGLAERIIQAIHFWTRT